MLDWCIRWCMIREFFFYSTPFPFSLSGPSSPPSPLSSSLLPLSSFFTFSFPDPSRLFLPFFLSPPYPLSSTLIPLSFDIFPSPSLLFPPSFSSFFFSLPLSSFFPRSPLASSLIPLSFDIFPSPVISCLIPLFFPSPLPSRLLPLTNDQQRSLLRPFLPGR